MVRLGKETIMPTRVEMIQKIKQSPMLNREKRAEQTKKLTCAARKKGIKKGAKISDS